jgi:hypothetical protein
VGVQSEAILSDGKTQVLSVNDGLSGEKPESPGSWSAFAAFAIRPQHEVHAESAAAKTIDDQNIPPSHGFRSQ